ncbi:reverse transcriptase domain-containing protein [Tanacetum coccineum]
MSTRSSSSNLVPPSTNPESIIQNRRRNLGNPSRLLDFEEINMANDQNNVQGPPLVGLNFQNPNLNLRSMEDLLQAPTDGVGDVIVVPPILANQFELKIVLLNLATAIAFHGFENDDPHSHIRRFTKITQTVKLNNVPSDIVKLLLFPFSLEGATRTWLEKEPPNSITTSNDLVSKFVNRFLPPSKTINLRNEIMRFQQRFSEIFSKAWDRFKDLINKCPHFGFSPHHQIDTFYNSLNKSEQDSLNSAANGNFLTKNTQEALTIIENKSKVQTSRNKPQVSNASGSSTQDAAIAALTKQVEALISSMNRPVNSIQNGCETCGGPHAYYECQAAGGYTQEDVYATSGTYNSGGNDYQPQGNRNLLSYRSNIYLRPPGFNNSNQGNNQNRNHNQNIIKNQAQPNVPSLEEMMFQHMRMTEAKMQQMQDYNNKKMQQLKTQNTNMENIMGKMQKVLQERPQGVLPSNTVLNPREDLKIITTWSDVTFAGPSVPPHPLSSSEEVERDPETITDQVLTESTTRVPPPVVQPSPASTSSELPPTPISSLMIPKRNPNQPLIPYPSSFAEALAHMPKFDKMVKDLLTNKEKLLELANTPLNENCSAVLLKKLPKKLGDTGRFLIPCDFYGLESCMALVDLGASINLMPLYIWKKLFLPELTPTRMTLELATRTVAYPASIAEDVFVQVGKFTFSADFVVIDYDVDPRVPLILGRPFLRVAHALVDVHGEELTLRVSDEKLVFNVESTLKYPRKHGDESIHKIDILDITCEDHFHEVLNVQKSINSMSGSPTPSSDPVVASLSLSLTPFGDSDFILEEIDTFLASDDLTSSDVDDGIFDPEGDIRLIEELLNNEIPNDLPLPHPVYEINETKKIKTSIDDPPDLELKDLPPHLEYAFLEGASKLPIIIAKDSKREEKEQLLKVLKSHKRAIAWKISDIQGIDPNFCTHKILMEDDFKPYFQIPVDPKNQEKTTFTCPYGTFAYQRMPFGLCNATGTFQRCMVAIFHDMIEKTMEVFMDDFSVFGDSFSSCLSHLDMMLKWCEDTNLVLNWEKCHFMVKKGIVLGHKISKSCIEVDRAKVDVIAKLPPSTTVKGIRSFLGHAGFYKRFIKYFSKIARPMTHLLEKDTPFFFSSESVLGKRKDKYFRPIHYASKTLSDAQTYYTTTEKELLDVMFAFEKFWSYLVLSKTILYTDHSTLKYLFTKQDTKPRLLRWILLLQEFNIEIRDKKRAENLVADHLSRLENPHQGDLARLEMNDNFPHESLNMISLNPDNEPPWFADIANYLVGNVLIKGMSSQQKKKFFKDV